MLNQPEVIILSNGEIPWKKIEKQTFIYSSASCVPLAVFEALSMRNGICFVKLIIINVLSVVFSVNYSKHLISWDCRTVVLGINQMPYVLTSSTLFVI